MMMGIGGEYDVNEGEYEDEYEVNEGGYVDDDGDWGDEYEYW